MYFYAKDAIQFHREFEIVWIAIATEKGEWFANIYCSVVSRYSVLQYIHLLRRNAFQVREILNEFLLFFIYLQFRNSIIRGDTELLLLC